MAQTKQEIRVAWNKANYQRYLVQLRINDDAELIQKVESLKAKGYGTTEIFRMALEKLGE
jgi:hypothetical protein